MVRRRRHDADEQALHLMCILGELDVWNDAHDGAACWYRVVRASYRRGELSRREWAAYRAAYGAAKRALAMEATAQTTGAGPAPVQDSCDGSRVA